MTDKIGYYILVVKTKDKKRFAEIGLTLEKSIPKKLRNEQMTYWFDRDGEKIVDLIRTLRVKK